MIIRSFFPNFGQGPFPKIAGKGPDIDGRGSGWGSGIHYSLKTKPIIHLIKILGYSFK